MELDSGDMISNVQSIVCETSLSRACRIGFHDALARKYESAQV